MSRGQHLPHLCEYLGRDSRGNYRFSIPSGSKSGTTHGCTIWRDGSSGVCSCEGYHRTGSCALIRGREVLVARAVAMELADELTDVAAGITYNLMEGDYVGLDKATEARVSQLQAAAGDILEVLDGH